MQGLLAQGLLASDLSAAGDLVVAPVGHVPASGGTESTALYSLTSDDCCAATGLATCTAETYAGLYVKGFTNPNTTTSSTPRMPATPAVTTVERVSIIGDTWPGSETDIVPTRYVQFAVAPAAGKAWAIDAISLWAGAAGGSNMGYRIENGKAADFSDATVLLDSPTNAKDTMVFLSLQPVVTVGAGQTLYIRVLPWLRSTPASGKYLCLQSLLVHGSVQ